jgi:DNA-binding FadR family transcriptional regulator
MDTRREPQRLRQTIQAVKELILNRGLRPGDPLPTESELTDLLEVSRANLREAIRTLVTLDILEVRHGTGTFVGQLSLRPLVEGLTFKGILLPGNDSETLREVVEVRVALDLALAPAMVARLTGEDVPELRVHCDEMDAALSDSKRFGAADRAFHLELAERFGNELYGQLVAAFWDVHTIVAPKLGVPSSRDISETAQAHRALLDAAVRGDLDGYLAAVHDHYRPLLRSLESSATGAPRTVPSVSISPEAVVGLRHA